MDWKLDSEFDFFGAMYSTKSKFSVFSSVTFFAFSSSDVLEDFLPSSMDAKALLLTQSANAKANMVVTFFRFPCF